MQDRVPSTNLRGPLDPGGSLHRLPADSCLLRWCRLYLCLHHHVTRLHDLLTLYLRSSDYTLPLGDPFFFLSACSTFPGFLVPIHIRIIPQKLPKIGFRVEYTALDSVAHLPALLDFSGHISFYYFWITTLDSSDCHQSTLFRFRLGHYFPRWIRPIWIIFFRCFNTCHTPERSATCFSCLWFCPFLPQPGLLLLFFLRWIF